jgi:hypothetical protein
VTRDRQQNRTLAWREALSILRERHAPEHLELYRQALEDADIRPVTEKPCRCGGTLRRPSGMGRWPARCGKCRGITS